MLSSAVAQYTDVHKNPRSSASPPFGPMQPRQSKSDATVECASETTSAYSQAEWVQDRLRPDGLAPSRCRFPPSQANHSTWRCGQRNSLRLLKFSKHSILFELFQEMQQ